MHPDQLLFFEADRWPDLECVPMGVRYKLDRSQIKISLRYWLALSLPDRQRLIQAAEGEQYAALVGEIAREYDFPVVPIEADPPPNPAIPQLGIAPDLWSQLTPFERFVCVKSRPERLSEILAAAMPGRVAARIEQDTAN